VPIKIQIVDDVASFIRGAGKAEDALDDVADSLDDLARDAQRQARDAGDDLGRGIERGADKAGDEVEKLEKSFRDMARDAGRHSKDAGDDLAKNVDRGTARAGEATAEFKDEARSNFSEVVSSFDGSMDSVADLAQGTFGGLAGSLGGPLGLIAGLGAAAFGAWYASAQENAEKIETRTQDMYADMLESGENFLSKQFIQQALADIYGKTEDAAIGWDQLQTVVEETGLTQETVARAFAGDTDAGILLTEAFAAAKERLKQREREYGEMGAQVNVGVHKDLRDSISLWEGQQGAIDDAAARATSYGDAARAAGVKAITSAEEARATYDGLGRKISELPATTTTTVRVEVDDAAWRNWQPGVKNGRVTVTSPSAPTGAYGKNYG